MSDPMSHYKVPKHRLLTAAQARVLVRRLKIDPDRLPMINQNDPAIITLQPQAGDIIEIERNSVVAGSTKYWRIVTEPMDV
jgi:DNA-directed RNA polymerase subunit H (RpoH/RPB5)